MSSSSAGPGREVGTALLPQEVTRWPPWAWYLRYAWDSGRAAPTLNTTMERRHQDLYMVTSPKPAEKSIWPPWQGGAAAGLNRNSHKTFSGCSRLQLCLHHALTHPFPYPEEALRKCFVTQIRILCHLAIPTPRLLCRNLLYKEQASSPE